MAQQGYTQLGFSGGILSRGLWARTDIPKRQTGAETIRNAFVRLDGSVSNRPGFEFIGGARVDTGNVRLIPFTFNNTDAYVLEFSTNIIRVIRNGGYVTSPSIPTAVTKANPVVVECSGSDAHNGDEVEFSGVAGMTQLNGNRYRLANRTTAEFDIKTNIPDTPAGVAIRVVSDGSLRVTAPGHTFVMGQFVWITGVSGMVQINDALYQVGETGDTGVPGVYDWFNIHEIPLEDPITITGASKDDPVEITHSGSVAVDDELIYIKDVEGMEELNGNYYLTTNISSTKFSLQDFEGVDIDGEGYDEYTGAGTFKLSKKLHGTGWSDFVHNADNPGTARHRTYELHDRDSVNIDGTEFGTFEIDTGASFGWLYSIGMPYHSKDIPLISYYQTANVMTFVHHDYKPRELTRTGHTQWSLEKIDFEPVMESPTNIKIFPTSYNEQDFFKANGLEAKTDIVRIVEHHHAIIGFKTWWLKRDSGYNNRDLPSDAASSGNNTPAWPAPQYNGMTIAITGALGRLADLVDGVFVPQEPYAPFPLDALNGKKYIIQDKIFFPYAGGGSVGNKSETLFSLRHENGDYVDATTGEWLINGVQVVFDDSPEGMYAAHYGSELTVYAVTAVSESTGEESLPGPEPEPLAGDVPSVDGPVNITWTAPSGGDVRHYNVYKEVNKVFGFIGKTEETSFSDKNITAELGINPPEEPVRNPFESKITGASKTNPVVITAIKHGRIKGDRILIDGVAGMGQLNKPAGSAPVFYWIRDDESFTKDAFAIEDADGNPIDGTLYDDYTGGGTASDYPRAVTYFNQRRGFAGLYNSRQETHWSATGLPASFLSTGDAFSVEVNSAAANEIKYMLVGQTVLLFTSGSIVEQTNEGQGFSLENVLHKEQTSDGVSDVAPLKMPDSILYVEPLYSRVRDLSYSFESNGYRGQNKTILVPHLIQDRTIVDWAFQANPEPIVWCVMSDDTLIAMTYDKDNDKWAWHTHDTPGASGMIQSLCVIPEAEGHTLYIQTQRKINGTIRKYIERLHTRKFSSPRDCIFMDAAVSFNEPMTVTNVTETSEAVRVWSASHGLVNNDLVELDAMVGATELNLNKYRVAVDINTLYLVGRDLDDAYNITGASKENPVKITHSDSVAVATGDAVYIEGVGGMEELNGNYYIAVRESDTEFTLKSFEGVDIDGEGYDEYTEATGTFKRNDVILPAAVSPYISGGEVRKCVTTVSGLDHLEGEAVAILNDGSVEAQKTVSSGSITLTNAGARIHAGLPYSSTLKLLPLDTERGQLAGLTLDLQQIVLKTHETKGLKAGTSSALLTTIPARGEEDYGQPAALFSGDENIVMAPNTDTAAQVVIQMDDPLPYTVQSVQYIFDVGGR